MLSYFRYYRFPIFLTGLLIGGCIGLFVGYREYPKSVPAQSTKSENGETKTGVAISRVELDLMLQNQLAMFVRGHFAFRDAYRQLYPVANYTSDHDRLRFTQSRLFDDPDRPTPIERILAYEEFMVWIRPILGPEGVVLYVGVGWTAAGPEVFFCGAELR